jgi:predicted aconitase with swiveling domain
MNMDIINGHKICGGAGEGEAIVYKNQFTFHGDIDPLTGRFARGHELEGQSISNKVLIFTTGSGSSQGARKAMETKKAGNAPSAMICIEADPITAAGVIMAGIPMVDRLNRNPFEMIETGDYIRVDATRGIVEISKKSR